MGLLKFDALAMLMLPMIAFIGLIVGKYSRHYLAGDTLRRTYFLRLTILCLSLMFMVCANNLYLLLAAWVCSNITLYKLMVHKSSWKAALASGRLALATLSFGFFSIALGFILLYIATGTVLVSELITHQSHTWFAQAGLILLVLGAMSQSALWPFHRWLLSSLNSPTPVSAIMHAGLVNGGGFLLARFAPLYLNNPWTLKLVFVIGLCSAILGAVWKLMQHDVKRMLACSTMSQMGFMFVQCGLGLFPAAIAHLCWHGMFKSYHFLSSGDVVNEARQASKPVTIYTALLALVCGLLGSYLFSIVLNQPWFAQDTTAVLQLVVLVTCAQMALSLFHRFKLIALVSAVSLTSLFALFYGFSVRLIETVLSAQAILKPQPLSFIYWVGAFILAAAWIIILLRHKLVGFKPLANVSFRFYVNALNSSQPSVTTITAFRNEYKLV